MIHFIIQFILFYISRLLEIILVPLSIPFVFHKHGWKGTKHMFDDLGLRADIVSAGRDRAMWNTLIVKKNGYKFTKDTDTTISAYTGTNFWLGQIKPFGIFLYYVLYIVDVYHWFTGGHCFSSMKAKHFKVATYYQFKDKTICKKSKS